MKNRVMMRNVMKNSRMRKNMVKRNRVIRRKRTQSSAIKRKVMKKMVTVDKRKCVMSSVNYSCYRNVHENYNPIVRDLIVVKDKFVDVLAVVVV